MAVSSKINISLENLPIGSIINQWGGIALSYPDNMNDLIVNNDKFIRNTNAYLILNNGNYSNKLSLTTTPIVERFAFLLNSTNYTIFPNTSNVYQTSSDGSSFSNYELLNININNVTQNVYYANNVNNKAIYINTNYTYLYTENGTTFTFVKSPIVSGVHIAITNPVISGSTYSFWDITNSKRIYTTNHTTFSDVTGFETNDLQIHRMNNGHLYTHTGTTLRISTDDGVSWTSYTLPATTNNSSNHCLDFDGTTYVYGTTANALYSSTDLTSWTSRTSGISATPILARVWFVNSAWFVFSATSSTTSFSTSTNGTTWTNRTSPNAIICNAVIFVNSLYMILGSNRVITSSDLIAWTSSIAFGNINTDAINRTFYGAGTKALMLASNVAYFYNAGSWTTVATTQQNTNFLGLSTTTGTGQFIKVR